MDKIWGTQAATEKMLTAEAVKVHSRATEFVQSELPDFDQLGARGPAGGAARHTTGQTPAQRGPARRAEFTATPLPACATADVAAVPTGRAPAKDTGCTPIAPLRLESPQENGARTTAAGDGDAGRAKLASTIEIQGNKAAAVTSDGVAKTPVSDPTDNSSVDLS